jgi:hypothetical protein
MGHRREAATAFLSNSQGDSPQSSQHTQHHATPHNSPQSLHVNALKITSKIAGKTQHHRNPTPTKPKINHKPPQLTTNPEDRFFPQPIGSTTTLDLSTSRKSPQKEKPNQAKTDRSATEQIRLYP